MKHNKPLILLIMMLLLNTTLPALSDNEEDAYNHYYQVLYEHHYVFDHAVQDAMWDWVEICEKEYPSMLGCAYYQLACKYREIKDYEMSVAYFKASIKEGYSNGFIEHDIALCYDELKYVCIALQWAEMAAKKYPARDDSIFKAELETDYAKRLMNLYPEKSDEYLKFLNKARKRLIKNFPECLTPEDHLTDFRVVRQYEETCKVMQEAIITSYKRFM